MGWILGRGGESQHQQRILGRWQSRKHQEPVLPPRQQLRWWSLSDGAILELGSLWKACNFQGKACMASCGQFQRSAATSSSQHPLPHLSTLPDSWACVPAAAFTQLVGAGVGEEDPSSEYQGPVL